MSAAAWAANGAVIVTVSRGSQSATGTGSLSGTDGSGPWRTAARRVLRHLDRRAPLTRFGRPEAFH